MHQPMDLEAKKPTDRVLAEGGTSLAQPANLAVTEGVAHRNGLSIQHVDSSRHPQARQRRPNEATDHRLQSVQASDPTWLAAQLGKAILMVGRDDLIGLFEGSHSQTALDQSDGEDLGIGKVGLVVVRLSPAGLSGMG